METWSRKKNSSRQKCMLTLLKCIETLNDFRPAVACKVQLRVGCSCPVNEEKQKLLSIIMMKRMLPNFLKMSHRLASHSSNLMQKPSLP